MVLELRPSRHLIDDNFGGYFLSLTPIPSYNIVLECDVDQVYPSDEQYTYIHAKLFSLHNHLFHDPWSKCDMYFIDKNWKIQKCELNSSTDVLQKVQEIWEIPSNHSRVPGHFPVTLGFPASDLVVVSDGAGTLLIVCRENNRWQMKYGEEVIEKQKPFIIMDSRCDTSGTYRLLHVLLLHLESDCAESTSRDDVKTKIATFVEWITFAEESSGSWSLQNVRQLKGRGLPDYLFLESDCKSIYIVSESPFKFISDTENPVVEEKKQEESKKEKIYVWQQNSEDVKIWLNTDKDTAKKDVKVSINDLNFSVQCREKTVLTGILFHNIDNDLTTWTLEENRLNIILQKQENGLIWRELLKSDSAGEEVLDDSTVQHIHERLSHLCSDKEVEGSEMYGSAPAFNMEQLEDCDNLGESQVLSRIDRTSHEITHQYTLAGHQWLFSVKLTTDNAPGLCIRHDVHGCLWQPEILGDTAEWSCTHLCTFPAFGYVQASKQNRKFTLCSTDTSYTVVCEANNHVYIYYKDTSSDLRHRRSGNSERTQVGKLNCIKVESTDPVIGVSAVGSHLFILTKTKLFQYNVTN